MKNLIPLVLALFLFGCNSQKEGQSETPNSLLAVNEGDKEKVMEENTQAEEKSTEINAQVGIDFLHSYIKNNTSSGEGLEIVEWTKSSTFVTDKFKNTLEKMVSDAWKAEPEYGLGFDPILDAQDNPDSFEVLELNQETGHLIAKGKGAGWDSFKVSMKLVNQNGKTLVDGCGAVNLSEDKRAER